VAPAALPSPAALQTVAHAALLFQAMLPSPAQAQIALAQPPPRPKPPVVGRLARREVGVPRRHPGFAQVSARSTPSGARVGPVGVLQVVGYIGCDALAMDGTERHTRIARRTMRQAKPQGTSLASYTA